VIIMISLRLTIRKLIPGLALVAAAALLPPLAAPVLAQSSGSSGMFGAGDSDTITARATVKSVDMTTRMVTLVGPQGETMTMKAGEQVQNLAQVQPGDVVVHYYDSVAYVVALPEPSFRRTPRPSPKRRQRRASCPAGGVASKVIVIGLVVGINPSAHTISLVNPAGGEIRTLNVKDPQYQQMLGMIKVGDTITAVITEALVAAVEPAT
jgi:hypothetical protein